jgi:DNA mismatch repair protein MutH
MHLPPAGPPRDEAELRRRLARLGGSRLGELAAALGVAVPPDLRRDKGWVGTLVERALGATAASRAEPDFTGLGIELKTLPIDAAGRPVESTFVASLDLSARPPPWPDSPVRQKLSRVAWLLVEADRSLPLARRRLGAALLWSPSFDEEEQLARDYGEITELLDEGFAARVTGHRGLFLQLRPKGRNAAHLRRALDEEGGPALAAPRAFYLRSRFTAALLARHFQAAAGG